MTRSGLAEIRGVDSTELFKVLSSSVRRGILKILQVAPSTVQSMANSLGMSRSSVTRHVQSLCDSGLVTTDRSNGSQNGHRLCRLKYDRIVVTFEGPSQVREAVDETEMPIGLFSHVEASPPCGLAGANGIIGSLDDPSSFLLPERAGARFLWIGRGFVEYVFPNRLQPGAEVSRLELAMEVGSEIALHRVDAASDITIWINGVEIGAWTSMGGLGEKRGRLTPAWWWNTRTQYGMLKVWSVDAEGSYVDGSPVSAQTLKDLDLACHKPIVLRIGVKPDAANRAGFNIFGRGFGNYEQDLTLRLHYLEQCAETGDSPAAP